MCLLRYFLDENIKSKDSFHVLNYNLSALQMASLLSSVSEFLSMFVRFYLQLGRGVPVILPNDVSAAMMFLADDGNRQAAGILPENKYMFANSREYFPNKLQRLSKFYLGVDVIVGLFKG